MKRTILATLLAALTGVAQAQSSVTLYGRLDNGIQYESGLPHGSAVSAESGDSGESWFGMRGIEDLGGGTSAIFHLEVGLNTQTGAYNNGSLFGRAATVGLSNGTFGTLNLGNLGAGEISQDSYDLDPLAMQSYAIQTLVRGRNWAQAGSGLEYTSAKFGGLTLKGQYDLANSNPWNGNGGFGSGPSGLGGPQGRSDGVKAQFNASNWEFAAIYDEIRDPNGQFNNVYVASRNILAGANLTLGQFRIYAGAQHLSAPDASDAGYFGTASPTTLPAGTSLPTVVNHEWFGVSWQATAFAGLTAAIYHANANNGNGNATMYTLAGQYNLSKRTYLYTEIAYIHNSATSNIGLGNGYSDPYGANSNNDPINGGTNTSPNYGHGQFGTFAGIMTQF